MTKVVTSMKASGYNVTCVYELIHFFVVLRKPQKSELMYIIVNNPLHVKNMSHIGVVDKPFTLYTYPGVPSLIPGSYSLWDETLF